MTHFAVAWLACAAVFLVVDLVWIGAVAKTFYHRQIGHLFAEKFRGGAALIFYVVYVTGVVLIAVETAASWREAVLTGALFGFFCYATYNLTNRATLRDWPLAVTLVDLSWGTLVTGFTAGAGYILAGMIL